MCSNYRPVTGRDLAHFGADLANAEIGGGDVYPGGIAPLLLHAGGAPVLSCVAATFGLLPVWAKDRKLVRSTYNARSETLANKPAFRAAWRQQQRCIVPARAIYEPNYESGKAEWWRIERADGLPLAIAGLWERKHWKADSVSWSFTMLTVNADDDPVMRRFHKPNDEKRSVVFLDEDGCRAWLDAANQDEAAEVLRAPSIVELASHAGRLPAT